jgi:Flp pilus assembly protein TadG
MKAAVTEGAMGMSHPHPLRERGAAAVEMALILPFLLLLVGGIVDFGRFFYTQNIVVNAAREGARSRALGYTTTDSTTRVNQSLNGVQGAVGAGTCSPAATPSVCFWLVQGTTPTVTQNLDCPATPGPLDRQRVTVTITDFKYLVLGPASRLFGGVLTAPLPTGTAEMRCGG